MAVAARRKRKRIVALEWDERSVRIVHAMMTKKGVVIEKVLSVEIPVDVDKNDVDAMGQYIGRVLHEQRISTPYVVVDVPRDQVIVSTLRLPAGAQEEYASMVEFQIAKELPYPVSEAIVDFSVPASCDEAMAPVLVAAARREVVEKIESIVAAAGLKLDRIGLRPFANQIAVHRLMQEEMPDRLLFVDVGPALTEIDVFSLDSIPFSRAASVMVPRQGESLPLTLLAGESETTGEPTNETTNSDATVSGQDKSWSPLISVKTVVDGLVLEVTRSIEAYRAHAAGERITHALIAGELGVEEALAEAMQQRFDFSVELYNPASMFGWKPDEGASAAGFSAVLGLVLGQDVDAQVRFDFLHPKKTVTQTEVQLRKAPRFLGWAAAILVTLGLTYWVTISRKISALSKLDAQIAELHHKKSDREKFIKLVEGIKAFDNDQTIWVDDIDELLMRLPQDRKALVVDQVRTYEKGNRILLKARFNKWDESQQVLESLEAYRRGDSKKPRYDVSLGPPEEDDRDKKYPYHQDLAVRLLKDGYKPSQASEKKPSEQSNSLSSPPVKPSKPQSPKTIKKPAVAKRAAVDK